MTYRTIKAIRVHGPGSERQLSITIGHERLHASGVFANVYSAKLYRPTRMNIAIKKTWPVRGSSIINPEMYYLSRMKHPSVVTLLYHFTISSNDEICHCMVFDYLPTDMTKLRMHQPGRRFNHLDAKMYAFQMFSAIDYVNSLGIAHRDVKPSNMIVDERTGILKLADFGNAKLLRSFEENTPYQVTRYYRAPELIFGSVHYTTAIGIAHRDVKPSNMIVDERTGILKLADFGNAKLLRSFEENTPYQVTRYYRAPELIFGSVHYTTAIDVWACGCVLSEFVTGKVLLQGRTREDQARLVIDIFGYPTNEQCTAMKIRRPRYARKRARGLTVALEGNNVPPNMLELLKAILKYEPRKRMRGENILAHKFFDDLRKKPPPIRTNGQRIPPLDYDILLEVCSLCKYHLRKSCIM
uniref:Protein kinase domain-containing protein n=1 Tax=Ascaris lumbricoides TaxID=6252 RepID=A0A0M3I729_ASCLU